MHLHADKLHMKVNNEVDIFRPLSNLPKTLKGEDINYKLVKPNKIKNFNGGKPL